MIKHPSIIFGVFVISGFAMGWTCASSFITRVKAQEKLISSAPMDMSVARISQQGLVVVGLVREPKPATEGDAVVIPIDSKTGAVWAKCINGK